jgi:hypothetical protein
MFCTSGNDIDLTFGDVRADDSRGSAKWEAIYRFPPTKRRVHNKISGSFEFRDGLIWSHVDDFDLYRWTRMALGPMGTALGWSPMVKGKVRKGAQAQLGAFMAGERKTPAS